MENTFIPDRCILFLFSDICWLNIVMYGIKNTSIDKAVVSTKSCRDRRNFRQATKYRSWIRQAPPAAMKRRTECTSGWRVSKESCLRCFRASSPTRGCITESNLHSVFARNKTFRVLFYWKKIIKRQFVYFFIYCWTCILTHWGRVMQICVFTLQLCKTDDVNLRF